MSLFDHFGREKNELKEVIANLKIQRDKRVHYEIPEFQRVNQRQAMASQVENPDKRSLSSAIGDGHELPTIAGLADFPPPNTLGMTQKFRRLRMANKELLIYKKVAKLISDVMVLLASSLTEASIPVKNKKHKVEVVKDDLGEDNGDHAPLAWRKAHQNDGSYQNWLAVVAVYRDVQKHCYQLALTDPGMLEEIFQEQAAKMVETHSSTKITLKKENEDLKSRLDGLAAEAEKDKEKVVKMVRAIVSDIALGLTGKYQATIFSSKVEEENTEDDKEQIDLCALPTNVANIQSVNALGDGGKTPEVVAEKVSPQEVETTNGR
ncbi:hypothetical protein GIB67_025580 [Kingdonia uniflora]|uniref:Uncharacterized protein n=1 Tax=Kingdonia uniflora TaxID=39325 RepID=A0A7J7M0F5_9MAGN|nr:hypothetical protein GIB67_025580 [Kingdonia uniflora]